MPFLTGNGGTLFVATCYTHNNFQLPQAFYFPLLFIHGREVVFPYYLASLWQHKHQPAGHLSVHTGIAECK
jgi:hypothetical protein